MSEDPNIEDNILSNRNDDNQNQSVKQQFKLPKLVQPPSRARIPSRKQNKAPEYLPKIINQQQERSNMYKTQKIQVNTNQTIQRNQSQNSRDDFTMQIQQKLKAIMNKGENNNSQISELVFSNHHRQKTQTVIEDEDDIEFREKINQNKEIIKMHRQKNQMGDKRGLNNKNVLDVFQRNNKSKPKTMKPQSNYEKKMNNYNDLLQNKFLQRKKQSLGIIQQKPTKQMQRSKSKKIVSMKDALDEVKANFGYKQFKSNGQIDKPNIKDNSSKRANIVNSAKGNKQQLVHNSSAKNINKQIRKTEQNSPSKKINRTSALFDNIQTFLQNPTSVSKHEKFYKQLLKKLKNKDIHKLQEQIKQINQKMGLNQNYETKSTVGKEQNERQRPFLITQNPLQRTVRDWKRMQIKDRNNLHYNQSNFEKQLDYVSYLQQKNSSSLSKFIDHQKIMVELQINKKFSKSITKQTVSQANL